MIISHGDVDTLTWVGGKGEWGWVGGWGVEGVRKVGEGESLIPQFAVFHCTLCDTGRAYGGTGVG